MIQRDPAVHPYFRMPLRFVPNILSGNCKPYARDLIDISVRPNFLLIKNSEAPRKIIKCQMRPLRLHAAWYDDKKQRLGEPLHGNKSSSAMLPRATH
jgi:hypothetical protein